MKPLHWDQINPVTGTPFTWDDPNLMFVDGIGMFLEAGDPGYVPYGNEQPPAPAKKKPFRRKAKSTHETTPHPTKNTTMSTFKFNVIPNSSGGFTTRAVLGEPIVEADFTALVATAAGTTPQITTAVLTAFAVKLRECAAGCGWSPGLYGQFSVRPTSGGSKPTPDAFQNAGEINADIALSFLAEKIDDWRAGLTLESQGTKGLVTPVIDTIISEENQAENHYVVGTMIRLIGHDLRFDKTQLTQGVFFVKADGTEVRATVYGPITPSAVTVLVPTGLSGPLHVRIAAFINGSVRSYTYTHTIS